MIGRRVFPQATPLQSVSRFRGMLTGRIAVRVRRYARRQIIELPVQLDISIPDFAGGAFSSDIYSSGISRSLRESLLDHLAESNGIVFFFDPVTEQYGGGIYEYFQVMVDELRNRLKDGGMLDGSRLPHRVAVCVAKYDTPKILDIARNGGLLAADANDPYMFPRVTEENAESFFNLLCRRSPDGGPELFSHAIRQYFHPERVRYFAVSSVGFYLGASGRFEWEDYYNVEPRPDGNALIRGNIYPINVLEPILWLGSPNLEC